ncbi:MAG: hypothetical protein KKC01_07715 [Gammaproteobacteria bacterium]|nr:hypothetical protein [Gammaproteobacteria bacterium]
MLNQLKKRIETGAMVTLVLVPLALTVCAFLGLAGYFVLRSSLPPAMASLVVAAAGIVLITVILIMVRLSGGISNHSRSSPEQADFDISEDLERLLREQADPVLRQWIRENPDRAALTTLCLGIAAGYSGRFRQLLLDMYSRYADTETLRQSRR